VSFRSVAKEPIPGQAPCEIVEEIRLRAARGRQSCSAVVTGLLCEALGQDPLRYGIKQKAPMQSDSASPN